MKHTVRLEVISDKTTGFCGDGKRDGGKCPWLLSDLEYAWCRIHLTTKGHYRRLRWLGTDDGLRIKRDPRCLRSAREVAREQSELAKLRASEKRR